MPSALITGVLGQDGSLLSELLVAKGYEVAGLDRAPSATPPPGIELIRADVRDAPAVRAAIARAKPAEIYHLAGQSSVGHSFAAPVETFESIALGTLNVLEAARNAE